MPTRSSRQLAVLSGLVALVAVVIGIVFFATSHPLRGIVLLIIAALAARLWARLRPPAPLRQELALR